MPDTIKRTTGTKVAFGDVVQLSKERSKDPEADGFERYIGLEHLEPSDLKVRSWGDIADGVTFTNVFRPGQVLFGKRRAYQRKVAVADFSGVCSGDIYVLEPKGGQLLPQLLPFICQSETFYDYVISMSQGGLSPRVNWKALAKYEFALPPLEEQRRIGEVLQAQEQLLRSIKSSLVELENTRRSYIDETINNFAEGASPMKRILDVSHNHRGGASLKPDDFTTAGTTILHKGDIGSSGVITLRPQTNRHCKAEASQKYVDKIIDKAFVAVTTRDLVPSGPTIGMICRIDIDIPLLPAQGVYAFELSEEIKDSYLAALSTSSWYRKRVLGLAVGSTQIHVRTSELLNLQIPIPSRERQDECVKVLAAFDGSKALLEQRFSCVRSQQVAVIEACLGGTR